MEKSKSKLKIWLQNRYRNRRYSMDMAKIMRQCESWNVIGIFLHCY
ncbi:unnamed protein product [Arabidopsis halleri]